jgi:uncharacterized membrane protein
MDPDVMPLPSRRTTFGEDFRRFFTRGLAALLPTLITLSILFWILDFLWSAVGRHLIWAIKVAWWNAGQYGLVAERPAAYLNRNILAEDSFGTKVVGVLLAVLFVYIVGLLIGNLIGRTFWAIAERLVMKMPIIRAIYPAVKQVTDFLLQDRQKQFVGSRVVAARLHNSDIWSIGLVTGQGLAAISDAAEDETVTVFIPSSPTSFSGYVVVVPRRSLIELPLTTEDAMRMLVSGGVLEPKPRGGEGAEAGPAAATPTTPTPAALPVPGSPG